MYDHRLHIDIRKSAFLNQYPGGLRQVLPRALYKPGIIQPPTALDTASCSSVEQVIL